jgi:hypothetical protein
MPPRVLRMYAPRRGRLPGVLYSLLIPSVPLFSKAPALCISPILSSRSILGRFVFFLYQVWILSSHLRVQADGQLLPGLYYLYRSFDFRLSSMRSSKSQPGWIVRRVFLFHRCLRFHPLWLERDIRSQQREIRLRV